MCIEFVGKKEREREKERGRELQGGNIKKRVWVGGEFR